MYRSFKVHNVLCVAFSIVFLANYLSLNFGLPRIIGWALEVISLAFFLLFIFRFVESKRIHLSPKYVVLFIVFVVSATLGAFSNGVQSGAVFAGIRNTFKFVPFFLLPLAVSLTVSQVGSLYKFLVIVALIQVPIAIYQWSWGPIGGTMDHVSGTMIISSYLSIFLISVISVLWSCFLCGKLTIYSFLLLSLIFLLPTTLNETKGSLFLLPISILVPSFFYALYSNRISILLYAAIGGVAFLSIFIMADYFFLSDVRKDSLVGFILEGEVLDYLYKDADEGLRYRTYGVYTDVGRIDSIVFAMKNIFRDPVNMFFGFGIGNVANSFSPFTLGRFNEFSHLGPQINTVGSILWEFGIIGLACVVCGCIFFFRDSLRLSKAGGEWVIVGYAWSGVIAIYTVALPYKNLMLSDINSMLFWFFSGVVVSKVAEVGSSKSMGVAP